jgi:hypothetical protein
VTSLVGDKDGFGIPGAPAVPADGTLWRDDLGGVFFADYRDAGDLANAPFTDIWDTPGGFSYTHTYTLGGLIPTSAVLDIQIAGIGDIEDPPYPVYVDSTVVGHIPDREGIPNAFQEVLLYSFNVPTSLIDGSESISVSGTGGDGYCINFSELRIIPEPSTLALLGMGAVGLLAYTLGSRRRTT